MAEIMKAESNIRVFLQLLHWEWVLQVLSKSAHDALETQGDPGSLYSPME